MNLNCDTTTEALYELISAADTSLPEHNIVIDYDGEVLIDPELYYPNVSVTRYKFYTQVSDTMLHVADVVQVLHEALMTVFESQPHDINYFGDLNMAA